MGKPARPGSGRPEYRRLTIDIATQSDLGRFFGAKLRAGVLYHLFDKTGDRAALEAALKAYRGARDVWAGIADRTKGVYLPDITVGETRVLRGHWADRLADIDADIAAVAAKLDSAKPARGRTPGPIARAIAEGLGQSPERPAIAGRHAPRATYHAGQALPLGVCVDTTHESVRLHYRVVNHAERWQSVPMQSNGRSGVPRFLRNTHGVRSRCSTTSR